MRGGWLGATLAALAAVLVGNGLGRFAYAPVLPALVTAGWFSPAAAAYLGAANLTGYMAGAALAPAIGRMGGAGLLRGTMALAAASFIACATPWSFAWFFLWRFAAGAAGGILMVLAASAVLPGVPEARRGLAGGLIFTGVGLGIAASGTVVPLLLHWGLVAAWVGLGVLSLVLTAAAWPYWPAGAAGAASSPKGPMRAGGVALRALYLEYALTAAGLVPHMVFLVDFIARGLGRGAAEGALYWVLLGLGAVPGPMVFGALADRLGFRATLPLVYAAEAILVALPAAAPSPVALALSSLFVGAFIPGSTTLVLGRARELVPDDLAAQRTAWSRSTIAFATGLVAASYALSYLYGEYGSYPLLFALAAGALALALAVDLAVNLGIGVSIK